MEMPGRKSVCGVMGIQKKKKISTTKWGGRVEERRKFRKW